MARGHGLNTSIVLAAVHGLSGVFRAVSEVEPSLFRPLPPLSPSLISNLAPVDVTQNVPSSNYVGPMQLVGLPTLAWSQCATPVNRYNYVGPMQLVGLPTLAWSQCATPVNRYNYVGPAQPLELQQSQYKSDRSLG